MKDENVPQVEEPSARGTFLADHSEAILGPVLPIESHIGPEKSASRHVGFATRLAILLPPYSYPLASKTGQP